MDLSGGTLLALTPVVLLVIGLVIFCLVDLIRAPAVRYLPKPLWALIILVGSTPLGAVLYLVLGRERQPLPSGPDHADDSAVLNSPESERKPLPAGVTLTDAGPVVQTAGLTRDYGGAGLFATCPFLAGPFTGSSVRTVPARRRCCRSSPGCGSPTAARSD
jgi:hypothetical protein